MFSTILMKFLHLIKQQIKENWNSLKNLNLVSSSTSVKARLNGNTLISWYLKMAFLRRTSIPPPSPLIGCLTVCQFCKVKTLLLTSVQKYFIFCSFIIFSSKTGRNSKSNWVPQTLIVFHLPNRIELKWFGVEYLKNRWYYKIFTRYKNILPFWFWTRRYLYFCCF